MAHFSVARPGMLTTVQDLGRWGLQDAGVPVAGPMDWYSQRLANRLVGNPDEAAALEVTLIGPELVAHGEIVCAAAGARFALTVDDTPVEMHRAFTIPHGARLRFGERLGGARASFAVRGGFDVPATFGSRATSLSSRLGPFGGRALIAGDELPVMVGGAARTERPIGRALALPAGGARVRVVMGPHQDRFTPESLEDFLQTSFTVTPQSNRMGYRLSGLPLRHSAGADILSDATPIGSVQVPGSGQPILLMADRQTTGGYPKIATVISADLPIVGQLAPGDWIAFRAATPRAAVVALRDAFDALSGVVR